MRLCADADILENLRRAHIPGGSFCGLPRETVGPHFTARRKPANPFCRRRKELLGSLFFGRFSSPPAKQKLWPCFALWGRISSSALVYASVDRTSYTHSSSPAHETSEHHQENIRSARQTRECYMQVDQKSDRVPGTV